LNFEESKHLLRQQMGYLPICINGGGSSNAALGAANKAVLFPFWVPCVCTINKVQVDVSGSGTLNHDLGIYDKNGNRVASIGSTSITPSGLGVVSYNLSVTLRPSLSPYFTAIAADSVNISYKNQDGSTSGNILFRPLGFTSSFPLPATLNLASPSDRTEKPRFIIFSVVGGQGF
jgi:hypothetical protein